jgi:hypothetical protein
LTTDWTYFRLIEDFNLRPRSARSLSAATTSLRSMRDIAWGGTARFRG